MTRKQKTFLLMALGFYPALSILDAMLWSVSGISFFYAAEPPAGMPNGAHFLRTMLTMVLGFSTAACASLIDVRKES